MPGTSLNLLVVDDEPMTRALLAQIFTLRGHNVRCAADGFSALVKIRESLPDVLLSDLNMPGMSGFELLSVVRRKLPEIYVVATSGAYVGKAVPEGIAADAFHQKATSVQGLVELMEQGKASRSYRTPGEGGRLPMWVHRESDSDGEPFVTISCTECLRAFRRGVCGCIRILHEAECEFCKTTVSYAVVEELDPATSQPYPARGTGGFSYKDCYDGSA